jgi:hypothetical protein
MSTAAFEYFVCRKHGVVYGSEWPFPNHCVMCSLDEKLAAAESRIKDLEAELFRYKRTEHPKSTLDSYPGAGHYSLDELTYSAFHRCLCGKGLAYVPEAVRTGKVLGYWDCSGILLGTAEIGVTHTDKLPFVFYEIKSEEDNSANGYTTRPI